MFRLSIRIFPEKRRRRLTRSTERVNPVVSAVQAHRGIHFSSQRHNRAGLQHKERACSFTLRAVEQVFGGIGFFNKEDSTHKGGTVQLISSSRGGEGGGGDGGGGLLPCTRIFENSKKILRRAPFKKYFSKWQAPQKKNLVFPEKIWDRTPVLGLSSTLI